MRQKSVLFPKVVATTTPPSPSCPPLLPPPALPQVLRSKSELADEPTRAVAINNSFADSGRIDALAAHRKTVAGAAKKLETLLQEPSKVRAHPLTTHHLLGCRHPPAERPPTAERKGAAPCQRVAAGRADAAFTSPRRSCLLCLCPQPGQLAFTASLEARLSPAQKQLLSLNRALVYLLSGRGEGARQVLASLQQQQQGGKDGGAPPHLLRLLQAALLHSDGKVSAPPLPPPPPRPPFPLATVPRAQAAMSPPRERWVTTTAAATTTTTTLTFMSRAPGVCFACRLACAQGAEADAVLEQFAASHPSSAFQPQLARAQLALEAGNAPRALAALAAAQQAAAPPGAPRGALVATQVALLTQVRQHTAGRFAPNRGTAAPPVSHRVVEGSQRRGRHVPCWCGCWCWLWVQAGDSEGAEAVLSQALQSLKKDANSPPEALAWCLEAQLQLQLRLGKQQDALATFAQLQAAGAQSATAAAVRPPYLPGPGDRVKRNTCVSPPPLPLVLLVACRSSAPSCCGAWPARARRPRQGAARRRCRRG